MAMAVGAGLQVMQAMMEADVTALAGPKGKHDADADRGAARPRTRVGDPGWAAGAGDPPAGAGGRRAGEVPIASYELFTSTEILGKMAMEKMLAGLSTRRYPVGLEPVGGRWTRRFGDEQVGGLPQVRGDDRNRAGRAARRTCPGWIWSR